jgi:hypothetical protein
MELIHMLKVGEEFARRTGHRFNIIIKSLPSEPSSGISFEDLLPKLQKLGYRESQDQLKIGLSALQNRQEIGSSLINGKTAYVALPKGLFESRKRSTLIKLHNIDITEEELKVLEKIALKTSSTMG